MALYVAFLWLALSLGESADAAFAVQVANRLVQGEVLYRDVFFGVTPLSAYLLSALVYLLGPELVAVKALIALCLTLTLLTTLGLARALGVTARGRLALGLASFAHGTLTLAHGDSLYTPLAVMFAMAAWSAVLRLFARSPTPASDGRAARRPLYWSVAWCALAFASKQNIGLLTLAGTLAATLLSLRRSGASSSQLSAEGARGAGLFCLLTAGLLAPIAWSGATEAFFDYAFLNKGTYLKLGSVSYFESLRGLFEGPYDGAYFEALFFREQALLWPLLGLLAVATAWRKSMFAALRIPLSLFLATGLLFAYPRPDVWHILATGPAIFVCVAAAWSLPSAQRLTVWPRRIGFALVLAGLLALVAPYVLRPLTSGAGGERALGDFTPFKGLWLPRAHLERRRAEATALSALRPERPFIVAQEAGLFSLLGKLQNPTPYDYPFATAFGRTGQERVARAIAEGAIRAVCKKMPGTLRLAPAQVLQAVRTHMRDAPSTAPCTLYRRHSEGEGNTYVFSATLSAAQPAVSALEYDAGRGFQEVASARRTLALGQQTMRVAFRAGQLRALRWRPCGAPGCRVVVFDVRLLSVTPGVDPDSLALAPLDRWTPGAATRVRRSEAGYEVEATDAEAVLTGQVGVR